MAQKQASRRAYQIARECASPQDPYRAALLALTNLNRAFCEIGCLLVLVLVLDLDIWVMKHRELRTSLFSVIRVNGPNL